MNSTQSAPEPVGEPEPPFSVIAAIAYGWSGTLRHWKALLPISGTVFLAQAILQWAIGRPTTDPAIIATTVAVFIVGLVMSLGLVRAALRITDGATPEARQVIDLRYAAPYAAVVTIVAIAITVGTMALLVGFFVAAASVALAPFVIADRAEREVASALSRGFRLVKPGFGPMLGLVGLLLVVNLIGWMLVFVGLVASYPITALALAYAYRSLEGLEPVPIARSAPRL